MFLISQKDFDLFKNITVPRSEIFFNPFSTNSFLSNYISSYTHFQKAFFGNDFRKINLENYNFLIQAFEEMLGFKKKSDLREFIEQILSSQSVLNEFLEAYFSLILSYIKNSKHSFKNQKIMLSEMKSVLLKSSEVSQKKIDLMNGDFFEFFNPKRLYSGNEFLLLNFLEEKKDDKEMLDIFWKIFTLPLKVMVFINEENPFYGTYKNSRMNRNHFSNLFGVKFSVFTNY